MTPMDEKLSNEEWQCCLPFESVLEPVVSIFLSEIRSIFTAAIAGIQ